MYLIAITFCLVSCLMSDYNAETMLFELPLHCLLLTSSLFSRAILSSLCYSGYTWLLMKLTPKGVVFSILFFSYSGCCL